MAVVLKNLKDLKMAVEIIADYMDSCPKCYSDNISNEDDSDMTTCHNCSHQFEEADYLDKIHVVALLRVKNLPGIADEVAEMSVEEFEELLDQANSLII